MATCTNTSAIQFLKHCSPYVGVYLINIHSLFNYAYFSFIIVIYYIGGSAFATSSRNKTIIDTGAAAAAVFTRSVAAHASSNGRTCLSPNPTPIEDRRGRSLTSASVSSPSRLDLCPSSLLEPYGQPFDRVRGQNIV